MAEIVTMGEIMLRLSIPNNEKFIQANEFDINYGGGEANVAVPLASYSHDTQFVTAVPASPIDKYAVAALRKYGVGTKFISRKGERLSIYYLETGSAIRVPNVVYDGAYSFTSTVAATGSDLGEIFRDAGWFHFTGITPAVSDTAVKLTKAACKAAKAHGVTASADLNFRKKLWSSEKARRVMTSLVQYVDVYIGSEENAERVPGFKPDDTDVTSDELELTGYVDVFDQMANKLGFKCTIDSLYENFSVSDNGWLIYITGSKTREFYHSRRYSITPIVGHVSGGDSSTVGLVCRLMDGGNIKAALKFAVTAPALKHTIPGDFNPVTRAGVDSLAGGDGPGRVQG